MATASMQLPNTRRAESALRRDRPAFVVHGRLSSFFHGTSIVGSRPTLRSQGCRTPQSRLPCFNTSRLNHCHTSTHARMTRSTSSTRSLVDRTSSLVDAANPLSRALFEESSGGLGVPKRAFVPLSRCVPRQNLNEQRLTELRRQHGLNRSHGRKVDSKYFPAVVDRAIRRKIFSCIASSIILALVLATCSVSLQFSHNESVLTRSQTLP